MWVLEGQGRVWTWSWEVGSRWGIMRKDCLVILCSKGQGKSQQVCTLLAIFGPHSRAGHSRGEVLSGCLKWPTAPAWPSAVREEDPTPSWVLPGLPCLVEVHTGASVYTQHGIFLSEPDPIPCCYSVTLGEFHLCGIPERLDIREEC